MWVLIHFQHDFPDELPEQINPQTIAGFDCVRGHMNIVPILPFRWPDQRPGVLGRWQSGRFGLQQAGR